MESLYRESLSTISIDNLSRESLVALVFVGFRWFSLVFVGFRWFSLVFGLRRDTRYRDSIYSIESL